MTGGTPARLHYLDAMRSVLMLMGVVLHAAIPYDSGPWRLKDEARLPLLDAVGWAIHLFRMPAFFVVAGFFAMYLLARRSTAAFLRERLRRVGVPLLATLLSLNVFQVWLTDGGGGAAGFLRGALWPAWGSGSLVSHLWFLAVLALYFCLVGLFASPLRGLARHAAAAWTCRPWVLLLALAVAIPVPLAVAVLAKLVDPLLETQLLGMVRLDELLLYLPCFALGILLQAWPGLFDRFARCTWPLLVLAGAGATGAYLTAGHDAIPYRAANLLATALLAWMVVRLVFAGFRAWLDRPSRTFAYLSDASYSIYLFHHLVVILVASALLPLQLGPGWKFLLVLAVATLLPLAAHHFLIRRSALLGYLFNGRTPRHGRQEGVPAVAAVAAAPSVRSLGPG